MRLGTYLQVRVIAVKATINTHYNEARILYIYIHTRGMRVSFLMTFRIMPVLF